MIGDVGVANVDFRPRSRRRATLTSSAQPLIRPCSGMALGTWRATNSAAKSTSASLPWHCLPAYRFPSSGTYRGNPARRCRPDHGASACIRPAAQLSATASPPAEAACQHRCEEIRATRGGMAVAFPLMFRIELTSVRCQFRLIVGCWSLPADRAVSCARMMTSHRNGSDPRILVPRGPMQEGWPTRSRRPSS